MELKLKQRKSKGSEKKKNFAAELEAHKMTSRAFLNSNLGRPVAMAALWRLDSFLCFVSARACRLLRGNRRDFTNFRSTINAKKTAGFHCPF